MQAGVPFGRLFKERAEAGPCADVVPRIADDGRAAGDGLPAACEPGHLDHMGESLADSLGQYLS